MFAGVEIGLAISIGLSVVIVLYKTGFPHMAVLGRLPGTTVYRSAFALLNIFVSLHCTSVLHTCMVNVVLCIITASGHIPWQSTRTQVLAKFAVSIRYERLSSAVQPCLF